MNGQSGPIGNFFLLLAEKSNGFKTISGVVLIVGGLATIFFTPEHREAGYNMIAAGVPMLLIGLTHKAVKKAESIKP